MAANLVNHRHTNATSRKGTRVAAAVRVLVLVALIVALACCLSLSPTVVATTHASASQHTFRQSFHCYRPFDALPSFNLEAMKASDNCRLDYQRVVDAAVRVDCFSHGKLRASAVSGTQKQGSLEERFGRLPSGGSATFANGGSDRVDTVANNPPDDRDGCYATMFVKSVREGGSNDRGYVKDDDARYGVKLHTQGGGVVHYKGMDGVGYSMCCMFLNQPEHSRCEWQNVTTPARHSTATTTDADPEADDEAPRKRLDQVVQYCGIEEPSATSDHHASDNDDDDDPLGIMGDDGKGKRGVRGAAPVVGYVTKPLHRNTPGVWTMEVLFYRGQSATGKVVVDFNVTEEMLAGHPVTRRSDDTDTSNEREDAAAAAVVQVQPDGASDATAAVADVDKVGAKRHRRAHHGLKDAHHHGRDHHKERHGRKHQHTGHKADGADEHATAPEDLVG